MSRHFRSLANELRAVTILALGALVAGCTSNTPAPANANAAATLPPVVAIVNGQSIPTKLYEMYLKNGQEGLGLDPNSEQGRQKLDQLREGIVSELIDRTLIAEEARRRGLSIPPERMAAAERRAITELGGTDLGGDQKYDAYLNEHHLSRDEYREVVRGQIYGAMLREDLNKGLSVSDEEVKTYYEAHRNDQDFQKPELVTAAHILIAARPNQITQQLEREKNLSGEALAAAVRTEMERRRQRADDLRRKAAAGSDFAALARQSSDDAGTRARGGDLGSFGRASHPAGFDDAALALKPGAVSAVVQTDFGFHVIKVSAHEPARTQTLAEAAPEVRRRLTTIREAEKLTGWLKDARRKASIRINEPFRFGALKNEFSSTPS